VNLRSVRIRILVGAVSTAVLSVLFVALTVRITLYLTLWNLDVASTHPAMIDACEADPPAWGLAPIGPLEVRFFGVDGRSAEPGRPPLPPELLSGLSGVGDRQVSDPPPRMTLRVRPSGPCAIVQVRERRMEGMVAFVPIMILGLVFLVVLSVGVVTYRTTVLPLLARIRAHRAAAVHVGDPQYVSAADSVDDELGDIGGVLDRSHARIAADREELLRRHESLEKYMAELAHDLRTPLSSLLLALQEVQRHQPGGPAVQRALQDTTYVSDLVENLHQATRLRHGLDIERGRSDLTAILRRLETRFRAIGAAEGVEVSAATPDGPVLVRGDPTLVQRAIGNLLHNAVRHGGEHVAAILSVRDGHFELVVADDGDGVPEPELADLAARTFQLDPARPRHQGLGVAIANEVATRLGWSIAYRRGPDGGLSVHLEGGVDA